MCSCDPFTATVCGTHRAEIQDLFDQRERARNDRQAMFAHALTLNLLEYGWMVQAVTGERASNAPAFTEDAPR